jgi:hypothetical protein
VRPRENVYHPGRTKVGLVSKVASLSNVTGVAIAVDGVFTAGDARTLSELGSAASVRLASTSDR